MTRATLRRLLCTLLLPLLLVAQHGAFVHALGHIERAEAQGTAPHGEGDAHAACALCLAFSAVQSIAGPAMQPAPALLPARFIALAWQALPTPAPALHAARNRGPPASF